MAETRTILDEIVGKIANAFNPEKIIIFGSYAYGRPTEKSDIVILVIMESNKREIDRMVAQIKLDAMGVRIDRLTAEQAKYLSCWSEGT